VEKQGCARQQLLLKRFQENDEIANLPWVQPELGHARMASHDPFAKRFFERLDWIPQVKSPEWRGNGQGTLSELVNGMAMRTVSLRKRLASRDVGLSIARNSNGQHAERDSNDHNRSCHALTGAHLDLLAGNEDTSRARGQLGKAGLLTVNVYAANKVLDASESKNARCEQFCSLSTSVAVVASGATAVWMASD
jgi:hypothetical protein